MARNINMAAAGYQLAGVALAEMAKAMKYGMECAGVK